MTHEEAVGQASHEESTPEQIHEAVMAHPHAEVHEEAAKNPKTPTKTLQHIYNHKQLHEEDRDHESMKSKIAAHPNAPRQVVKDRLDSITPDSYDHSYHKGILAHPAIDPKERAAKVKEIFQHHDDKADFEDDSASAKAPKLSWNQKELIHDYLHHPETDPKTVSNFIKHPHPEVAAFAGSSPHASTDDHEALFQRKDLKPSYISNAMGGRFGSDHDKDINPSFLHHAFGYLKDYKAPDAISHHYGEDAPEGVKTSIIKHKDVPQSVLQDVIGKKSVKKDDGHSRWNVSDRTHAFAHPSTSSETVKDWVQKGDIHAMEAAVGRPGTDEQTLRTIDSHGNPQLNNDMLKHPNYPKDLAMKRIHDSPENARELLRNKDIDPEILSEALKHKNIKVATEALRHPGITKEHVLQAYKRKAKDVSLAAAAHDLAPDEAKIEKAKTSPDAAADIARKTDDPNILSQIHSLHSNHAYVQKALANNKNTSPDVINKLIDTSQDNLSLNRHPNLDKEGRSKFLKTSPSMVADHPNLTGDEISGALQDWAGRTGQHDQGTLESFANNVLGHKNLKPEDAKDMVLGKYGDIGNKYSYRNDTLDAVKGNQNAFNHNVVKAGLNAPHELSNPGLVHSLAQSPQLTNEDLQSVISQPDPNRLDEKAMEHHSSRVTGALKNPNLNPDTIKDVLSGANENLTKPSNIEAVLDNPNLNKKHLEYAANNPALNLHKEGAEKLSEKIRQKGDAAETLGTTVHPSLAAKLVRTYSGGRTDKKAVIAGIQNKNPEVQKAVIDEYAADHAPRKVSKNRIERQNVDPSVHEHFDKLASSPDKEVVSKAFKFMSPEKQSEVASQVGLDNPDIISSMSEDAVKHAKLTPDMQESAATALLDHHNATPEHFKQAIAHSPEMARRAIGRLDSPDKSGRPRFEHEQQEEILSAAAKAHPQEHRLTDKAAEITRDPQLLRSMMVNPATGPSTHDKIAENPQLKAKDAEGIITKLHGPDHSEVMRVYAGSNKSTVATLQHIAKNYPEHLATVATNPRASSAKVLKTLVEKGDVETHANLVNNDKVPEGIKDELLKDPKVFLKARPENVSDDQLNEYAKDDDLGIAKAAINHRRATSETAKIATDHAFKNMEANPKASNDLLEAVSHKNYLEPETQGKLMMHLPKLAANVVNYSSKGGPFDKQGVVDAMNKFEGKEGYDDLLDAVCRNKALKDPTIAGKVIDTVPINRPGGVKAISHLIENAEDIGLKSEQFKKALDRMNASRTPEFKYPEGEDGEKMFEEDTRLMNSLIGKSPDKELGEYAKNPHYAPVIAQNPKVGKANLNIALDHVFSGKSKLDDKSWANVIGQDKVSPEHLDKIYQMAIKNPEEHDSVLSSLASSSSITPEMASKIYKEIDSGEIRGAVVANPKLPIEHLKEFALKSSDHAKLASQNRNFRLSMVSPEHLAPVGDEIFRNVADNQFADPQDLEAIFNQRPTAALRSRLIKNAKTSESLAKKLQEGSSEHDMYHNPAIGGKLWREAKHEFPEGTGLENGKEIHEAKFTPRAEKIQQVMKMIPNDGQLDWAEFKKQNPSLAADPLVTKMFTSAPKTRVNKTHAEEYLKNMPGKKFHISYGKWTGIQRHNRLPQTIFHVNNSEDFDKQLKDNPEQAALFRTVQTAMHKEGHPHTPQSSGWSRVDTNDKNHWFVDELQSDLNASLSTELNAINTKGRLLQPREKHHSSYSSGLEKMGLSTSQSNRALGQMIESLNGWEKATLQNIIDTAKAHGVKKVSIHSGQSKSLTNKGESAELTDKYDKIYNQMPEDMGFKPGKYTDLPTHDPKNQIKDLPIWTLDLSEPYPFLIARIKTLQEVQK